MTDQNSEDPAAHHEQPDDAGAGSGPAGETAKEKQPLPLEGSKPAEEKPSAEGSVRALDVCPNCGAPMRDTSTLVCLRCGFDLKRLEVIETKTGETTGDEEGEEKREPLVGPGPGDLWLPLTIAGIALAVLAIGCLAGMKGLFPTLKFAALEAEQAFEVDVSGRLIALVRMPALILLWTICGFGSLVAGAWMFSRPFGDVRLAATRMVAIVAAARVLAFIDLPAKIAEFPLEAIGKAIVFLLLTMWLFRLSVRDAATLLAMTIVSFAALYLVAHLVMWVT
jgi:hypothetical protein